MLDPRIYRTGLIVVVLAVIVLAFSLGDQQGPLGTTLAPDAFNGQNAVAQMTRLAADPLYRERPPGSAGDDALAAFVARQLRAYGLATNTSTFTGRTVDGPRNLKTVTATLAGISSGSIVIVSHRDAASSPDMAGLSGTAVMLELARVLAGETHHRSIVLASISGSSGGAGTAQLARSLATPVDAVIVLGDLASTRIREPVVVPWSSGQPVAPAALRNTVAAAVAGQASIRPGGTSLAAQLAHLALPLSVSEQGPFGVHGQPAVLVSASDERASIPNEPVDYARVTALGRAMLQAVSALDTGPTIPSPAAYLLLDGKVVPAWAIRLLVLALILPVLMATIDGLARARRRGHSISPWVIWVLAAALPFAVGLLVVLSSRLVGLIGVAPPGAVGAGAVAIRAGGAAALVAVAVAVAFAFAVLRPLLVAIVGGEPHRGHRRGEPPSAGAAAAILLLLCGVSLAIWVTNPFAAALMVLALHLWMWVLDPDVRVPVPLVLVLLAGGLAPAVLVVLYYVLSIGLSPLGVAWNGLLLIAGGQLGVLTSLEWSVALGCAISVFVVALRAAREHHPEEVPITVRGPITYAGPGSLGGTESALRR